MDEKQCMTIRDIAEELGLSTTTVSNVIYGRTKKISDETVNCVQGLLEEIAIEKLWELKEKPLNPVLHCR